MKVLFEDEENAVEVEREFETRDLLAAVDVFDEMRTYPRTTPQLHEATPLPPPASDGPNPAQLRRPKVTGFPANAAAGSGLLWSPERVHTNVEQLPLTDVRDNPDKSVVGKSHVNPSAPQCPGFVISHGDAVAAGQGQEDFDSAFPSATLSTRFSPALRPEPLYAASSRRGGQRGRPY